MENETTLNPVSELLETMERLQHVLEEETQGVYKHSNEKLKALAKEKSELFAAYTLKMNAQRDTHFAKESKLSHEERTKLQERHVLLQSAIKKNMLALSVAQEAAHRVMDVIVQAVRQQRQSPAGYALSANGSLLGTEGDAQGVTLNTRL